MTFKEYIDSCTWEDLKTAQGVKDFMQDSLADLKSLEPKYTDDTGKYTIHFSENTPDEDDSGEEYVKYHAFIISTDYEWHIGVFESCWDEMLPLEVCIEEGMEPTPNDIIVSVIWGLTWMGFTSAECKKAWEKWDEDRKNRDYISLEDSLEISDKETD